MSDKEFDRSGNSKSSFHVRADILHLLFLYDFLYFSVYSKCEGLIKADIYYLPLSLFYLKDWVIVCKDQMFYYSWNS